MRYNFEWDPIRAMQNIRKHKVSFQRGGTIFRDPHAISIFDDEDSKRENADLGQETLNTTVLRSYNVEIRAIQVMAEKDKGGS